MSKAPKPFRPAIATANALRSGAVVFRTPDGGWSRDVAEAEIAETQDAAAALLAKAVLDQDSCKVVEPVLIEIRREGAFVLPGSLRELIRATGPTVAPGTRA